MPKGGERICHRRRRKKILGDELIRNELSLVIIVCSVFLQWKDLWFARPGDHRNIVLNDFSKHGSE